VINLGLAHYIEHRRYDKPRLKSSDPALIQFLNHDEREVATDKVINSALRTAKLQRNHMAALEWAVNEITDNVLTHSDSKVGGFLISQRIANSNIIEFTVADAGIGVAKSLRISDESEALEKAIQEGVTKNKSTNQGNGLYGSYKLSLESSGVFVIKSGHGNLFVGKHGDMHVRHDNVPFDGTFVVCQVDCDRPDLIERAFVFNGRNHIPAYDYIEKKHELLSGDLTVKAEEICNTFGSRLSGAEARRYISNIMLSLNGGTLNVDFNGVHVISSSFADEVFGKLFVELGPMQFMRNIKIVNAVSTVEGLIDRAITLRSKTGL
jgi:anti-sigma regulatory factor (Ser/Thr protein kinase)